MSNRLRQMRPRQLARGCSTNSFDDSIETSTHWKPNRQSRLRSDDGEHVMTRAAKASVGAGSRCSSPSRRKVFPTCRCVAQPRHPFSSGVPTTKLAPPPSGASTLPRCGGTSSNAMSIETSSVPCATLRPERAAAGGNGCHNVAEDRLPRREREHLHDQHEMPGRSGLGNAKKSVMSTDGSSITVGPLKWSDMGIRTFAGSVPRAHSARERTGIRRL
jgi:hypothetical protein